MSPRLFVALSLALLSVPLAGQTAKKKWAPPRTPDGQPDLQGVWTNPTVTPFERPAALANKAVLTKEEAAKVEKEAAATNVDAPPRAGDVGNYNRVWFDSGTKVVSTRQSSLVVEPPDGRVPLKAAAEAKRDYDAAHNADSWEYMSVWDRCITRGVPAGMFPAGYNNAYQIVQNSSYVAILYEMIHETRIIPIDGSKHLPDSVRQWNGDSRGHWEGDTLVVDTTNYNGKGQAGTSAATGRVKGIPQSEKLHVVERFTRTDPDTISYEVTIDDPEVYTKPWKVAIPLARDANYRIYEYACHEGNEAVANVLRNGRALEKTGQ
ncbi:MAG TPA: hypothetical protein VG297_09785 [Bryobacteraceae bacterium]|jgi:hypothetical protein|nr:hypothetical protein [Bryobacteraceae bacterium]